MARAGLKVLMAFVMTANCAGCAGLDDLADSSMAQELTAMPLRPLAKGYARNATEVDGVRYFGLSAEMRF